MNIAVELNIPIEDIHVVMKLMVILKTRDLV